MIYIRRSRRTIAVAGLIVAVSAVALATMGHLGAVHTPRAPLSAAGKVAAAGKAIKATCDCTKHVAGALALQAAGSNTASFVQITTGKQRQFAIDTSSGTLASGGQWTAEYGTIDAQGNYTAPPMLPPAAIDTITYTDPNSASATISVDLVPDPSVPGSSAQPYIENASLPPDPYSQTQPIQNTTSTP